MYRQKVKCATSVYKNMNMVVCITLTSILIMKSNTIRRHYYNFDAAHMHAFTHKVYACSIEIIIPVVHHYCVLPVKASTYRCIDISSPLHEAYNLYSSGP